MKNIRLTAWIGMLLVGGGAIAIAAEPQALFNGKDLSGWKGDLSYWSVKDGVILGQTTPEHPTGGTFLVWDGGEVSDFEITLKVRYEGNNSGLQYRSTLANAERFTVNGYQADLHPRHEFFGMMYHQGEGRGVVAQRFQQVEVDAQGEKKVVQAIGDKNIKWDASKWNELRVVAVGNRMIHQINGITTVDVIDNHPTALRKGILGLQLHGGAPMKVEYKDIVLRKVEGKQAASLLTTTLKQKEMDANRSVIPITPKVEEVDFLAGKKAKWIWKDGVAGTQPLFFTKNFKLSPDTIKASILTTCDNGMKLWINGKLVTTSDRWEKPFNTPNALEYLKPGNNLIAIEGSNVDGIAALIFKLALQKSDGSVEEIISDLDWKASPTASKNWNTDAKVSANWNTKLKSVGELGDAPWANLGLKPNGIGAKITTLPGFEVDELFAFPSEMGSKVSLTIDDKGRFYASDQYEAGLHRVTVNEESGYLLVEKVPLELEGAQGMAWHEGALYYYGRKHLQKLTDTDGDGILDKSQILPSATNSSEHGTHTIRVTEDGKGLYLVAGNHTPMPNKDITSKSRVQGWQEDLLLKREWDARGHARGLMAPGGYFARYDFATQKTEILSVGFRNQYGVAQNRFGDLFTYDADMEWDMGTPWYRPTRINFVASGADFGWRAGSGKWPEYYEDSLPAIAEIGPGSPTGVISGLGTKFPAKYQDAVYALDWTFGTMYAVHLKFDGAGYKAEKEVFCYGEPLPLTDAVVGPDGYLYFTVGGRKASSRFCRIKYTGKESTESVLAMKPVLPKLHQQRQALELFHGVEDPKALAAAWPLLSSNDRWLRGAARVAVESQPVDTWANKVFTEKNPQALITSAVALARQGDAKYQEKLLNCLLALDSKSLSNEQNTGLLRAYALCFIRMGEPQGAMRDKIIAKLEPQLPSKHDSVNTELVRVLVSLKSPNIIEKALALIAAPHEQVVPNWQGGVISRNKGYGGPVSRLLKDYPPVQKLGYAFMLRNLKDGWTIDQRRQHISFINSAAKHPGGLSYTKFLLNVRDEILSQLTPKERVALNDVTGEDFHPKPKFAIHPPKGPGKNWTLAEARPFVSKKALKKANIVNGRSLFHASACAACHRFDGLGGDIGPDLSMVRTKFRAEYLLDSIINPSKEISDQYSSKIVTLKDGRVFNGVVVPREEVYDIYPTTKTTDELKPTSIVFEDVATIVESPISQMPPMLINGMNGEEVRDLIGYLLSSGIPNK